MAEQLKKANIAKDQQQRKDKKPLVQTSISQEGFLSDEFFMKKA